MYEFWNVSCYSPYKCVTPCLKDESLTHQGIKSLKAVFGNFSVESTIILCKVIVNDEGNFLGNL